MKQNVANVSSLDDLRCFGDLIVNILRTNLCVLQYNILRRKFVHSTTEVTSVAKIVAGNMGPG